MAEEWNLEQLQDWLKDKPVEVSVAIAGRAALRVFPMVAEVLVRDHSKRRQAIILPIIRASAVASAAGKWPAQRQALAHAAAAAGAAAAGAAAAAAGAYAAAADAAYAAAHAAAAWKQIETEVEFLSRGDGTDADWIRQSSALCGQPLWHRAAPDRVDKVWHDELRPHLLAADEGWEVWTDWYDGLLAGEPRNEALEVAIALIPEDDWAQGPAHVNAIIADLIEEHSAKPGSGRLRLNPETARIEREPEPVDNAARYRLAIDRVRERLKSIEQAGLGNQHSALESILSELQPAITDPDYTAGQVHGRFRSALRMIDRAVRNGYLPEDDDVVDNLTVDLGESVIDVEAASAEVKEAADQYRAARMQTPGPELAEKVGPASDAFVAAADKPEGDLAREGGAAFGEAMQEHGPRAPVPDAGQRATLIEHAWRLIRTARLKLPDKATRDRAVGMADRWGKVGKAIELAGSAVIGLLSWLARFL